MHAQTHVHVHPVYYVQSCCQNVNGICKILFLKRCHKCFVLVRGYHSFFQALIIGNHQYTYTEDDFGYIQFFFVWQKSKYLKNEHHISANKTINIHSNTLNHAKKKWLGRIAQRVFWITTYFGNTIQIPLVSYQYQMYFISFANPQQIL